VTSNVGQNYPYSSESEADRAATIARLFGQREGLAAKVAAETTPVDPADPGHPGGRWWVYKCPTPGCPGLLHVAGFAHDLHAVYVVCDGTCAKNFLR
jgi:hypothetical protein